MARISSVSVCRVFNTSRIAPIFAAANGFTRSHQFAVDATSYGGGQKVSKLLRAAGSENMTR